MRIIEPHSVCNAPPITSWLKGLAAGDPVFTERFPLKILGEYAGTIAGRDGPLAVQIAAIWREDVSAHLSPGESAVPFNALMMIESDGRPFIADWIGRYGMERWAEQLVEAVVMPICHLLAGHGIATECHGQNLVLIHREGWPVGLAMRDFHDSVEYVPRFLRDPAMPHRTNSYGWRASNFPANWCWIRCSSTILPKFPICSATATAWTRPPSGLASAAGSPPMAMSSGWLGQMAALGLFQHHIRTESLLRRKLAPSDAECAHENPNGLAFAAEGVTRDRNKICLPRHAKLERSMNIRRREGGAPAA